VGVVVAEDVTVGVSEAVAVAVKVGEAVGVNESLSSASAVCVAAASAVGVGDFVGSKTMISCWLPCRPPLTSSGMPKLRTAIATITKISTLPCIFTLATLL
jgi:hypothetical protein